jgi:Flp pilus assembly protein TadB
MSRELEFPLPAAMAAGGIRVRKEHHMLWTIAVVLIVLWLLWLVSSYTMGGFIHIILVIAIILFLVGIIQGRRS